MRLTRRDALAALTAAGVAVGGGAAALTAFDGDDGPSGPLEERHRRTLAAAGDVLFPDDVEGVGAFVRRYASGVASDRPDHARGMATAATVIDEYARAWEDAAFATLPAATRDELLRSMGLDAADPVPDGDETQRVRYYVVEELLFALYSSPTGGSLVGIENPPGHPGGTASYQQGPATAGAAASESATNEQSPTNEQEATSEQGPTNEGSQDG